MGLLLIGAMVFVLWKVPKWQLEGEKLQAERRIQLENDLRKTLAQIMGGAFVLLGGYLAWRRVTALERTVAVTQEGQITERFTRAIQLLGDRANLEVRLGGIYALERIAKDSPKDHWTIMEVLTAYVREKSPWKGNPSSGQDGPPYKPAPDIQSILTVIGRRTLEYEKDEDRTMNLMETDLRGVGLIGAHLEGVGFFGTHLEGAGLYRTHLERAVLVETHFEGARMCETHFEGAFLLASHLEGADLRGSHFERARLDRSNLDGANLDGANFDGANLEGVNLQGVKGLTKEQIKAAIIDDKTTLPHYLRNS